MAQRRSTPREHFARDSAPQTYRDEALSALFGRKLSLEVERMNATQAWVRAVAGVASVPTAFGSIPPDTRVGGSLDVFLCEDATQRPVASLTIPLLVRDEVRFLNVVKATADGAWVDWGLPTPLFVPKREQITRMRVGESYPIALSVERDGVLLGTAHVTELLHTEPASFEAGQWVTGQAWRNDPEIGLFVILEGKWVGRVPPNEPHQQQRGQTSEYRVSQVLPDGKLEVSLRATKDAELPRDVDHVLAALRVNPRLRVGDDTSPEHVRQHFGLSKKSFKRALGVLFKRGDIEFDAKGFARVKAKT